MKTYVGLAAMTLVMCASPAFASTAISLVTPGPEAVEAHRTLGFEFSADNAQSITALGAYDSGRDGLAGAATVGVWDLFGNLLASATVPSGTGGTLDGDFRFVAITPLALAVGQHYVVGSWDEFDLQTNWGVGPTAERRPRTSISAFTATGSAISAAAIPTSPIRTRARELTARGWAPTSSSSGPPRANRFRNQAVGP